MKKYFKIGLSIISIILLNSNFLKADERFIQDLVWIGCDDLNAPFPKICKNETEKQALLNKGMVICENKALEGSDLHQMALANYHYFVTKNTKRSLYWALKCAEQGNPNGMLLLFDAYKSGNGVIPDAEEAMKWLWLASSLGNPGAKEIMQHPNAKKLFQDSHFANRVYERCQQWMKDDPKAFFNPNGIYFN